MDEQRMAAYLELIGGLLNCPNGQEVALLQENAALVDAGLVEVMGLVAQHLESEGQENNAGWLRQFAGLVAQALGLEPEGGAVSVDAVDFVSDVMVQIAQVQCDPMQVYGFWQANITRFDQDFLAAIPVAFQRLAAQKAPKLITVVFGAFGDLIQQFPLGIRGLNLEMAISAYSRVLELEVYTRDAFPEDWAGTQTNLAIAYCNRIRGERAENLEQAIAASQQALEVYTRDAFPEDWAMTQSNLGTMYRNRIRGERTENLEAAIAFSRQALEVYTRKAFPKDWAMTHNNLANAYCDRLRGERAENLEKAIAAYQRALEVHTREAFPGDWAMTQSNLANAYRDQIRGERAENLEKAIASYQRALEVRTREAFPEDWAITQNNLAIAYCNRIRGERAENLEKAIAAYQRALEVHTREAFPEDWAMTQNNLAIAYCNRIRGERAENLEQAIASYQRALEVYTHDAFTERWAGTQNNLANVYTNRIRGEQAENLEQAIAAYQRALEVYTRDAFPQECRLTSRSLGNLQAEQQNWPAASDAYTEALAAAETLYTACLLLDGRAAELQETADLPRRAAYAYVKTGQLDRAITTIERGRARGLSETLNRDRADLQQLQKQRTDLYTAYQDIPNQLRNLESQQRDRSLSAERNELTLEDHRTEAQRLNQELTETIAQIRQVPGYQTFLQPPDFSDLQTQLSPNNPLVYLIVTPNGSLALIATPDRLEQLWLDDFNETQLTELLNDRWLKTYQESRTDRQSWLDAIETVTGQLWEPLMSPLIDRLQQTGHTRATLIPTGYLSLLPLHAAWTTDNTQPTGKRYALDEIHFTYAPNAQSLIEANKIAQNHPNSDSILAIDNPLGDLRYSTREVNSAIAHFTHHEVLSYDRATVANVAAQLGDAAVVHFSCHGSAITIEPLNSHLQLHTTEIDNAEALEAAQLKLVKIFELNLSDRGGLRLAILSACETGLTGIELADEAIGLPTGLMQAGVAGVIASLWKVDDLSTSLLMQKFYNLWRKDKLEPSEALRRAQIWLRDSTNAEKNAEKTGLRRMKPNDRDFKHPFHWAAFSYLGL
jgi:CHAT domain-containing protein